MVTVTVQRWCAKGWEASSSEGGRLSHHKHIPASTSPLLSMRAAPIAPASSILSYKVMIWAVERVQVKWARSYGYDMEWPGNELHTLILRWIYMMALLKI